METYGAFDVKTHFGRILRLVETGRSVVITRNGRPVAELRPIDLPAASGRAERIDRLRARIAAGNPSGTLRRRGESLRDLAHLDHRS